MLSSLIGKGVQTFRIKNLHKHFEDLHDFGPDNSNFLFSRKLVKLISENKYYALVKVFYKDVEEFIIYIPDQNINSINWKHIADISENCRWNGSDIDSKYINEDIK